MKRLLCFILVLLLLIPSALADEQKMTFRLEDVNGNVGDTVTVIGAVENAPACASFRVIFTYDNKVLKPEKVQKLDCGGLFMSNVNFVYQGKSAINVLSADSKKSFEGNVQLFSITFTILAESPETDGSPITLVYKEFFDPSTPRPLPIQPNVENGRVYVGDDKPAAPDAGNDGSSEGNTDSNEGSTTPSNPGNNDASTENGNTGSAGDGDSSVSNPTDTPTDGTTDQPENDTPTDTPTDGNPEIAPETPEDPATPETEKEPAGDSEPEEEDKTPTGSWIVDPETEDIYHINEEGEETVFVPEYTEKPEPGKVTEVILKDKETGKEAGSIKVEGNEDGTFEVIEQDVPSLREPSNQTDNAPKEKIWLWVGIGAGTLALAGIAIWVFYTYRKLK